MSRRDNAGDAFEVVDGRRGVENTVFHKVDVVAGTFSEFSGPVEEDCLVATLIVCLDLAQNIVQVVEGFDVRREGCPAGFFSHRPSPR